jgi:hypothetical protein
VLADLGCLEEARTVLEHAHRDPIARRSASLGEDLAGVALAHLALHRHTGDAALLERAAAAGEALLASTAPATRFGANDAIGLLHGRSGVALFLRALAAKTGEPRYLEAGRTLLHQELDRALALPDGALSFADDATASRALPYLQAGSAGVAMVLMRYVAEGLEERFTASLPAILADVRKRCTTHAGLYCGLAGLAFVAAEHADWLGTDDDREAAAALATGLLKHAVPHTSGVRFLGDGLMRYSAELWSGGAGILLALDRVLHGDRDHFFTLDSDTALVPTTAIGGCQDFSTRNSKGGEIDDPHPRAPGTGDR